MSRSLTQDEVVLVRDVQNGADIYLLPDARGLRTIERELPGIIRIMKARTAPKDGSARQPYFGVKATAAGKRLVAA